MYSSHKGWVKGKQGEYHDALFNKNNRVEIVLHEHLGGGFSPPAAQKMRRNGRKAKDHGVDRTPYHRATVRSRTSATTLVQSLWGSPRPSRGR